MRYERIWKNSLVLLDTNARFEELEEGQMIAFRANNAEVLHRITDRSETGLIVTLDKGTGETVINKSLYVGKEVISFPFVGRWLRWVLDGRMWTVVVVAVGLIVIGCLPWGKKDGKPEEAGKQG